MKFPKLHLACSDDDLRPHMACICVDKEYTFASNAHILVRHKTSEIFNPDFVSSLPDQSIMIPRKAIYLTCQKATVKIALSDDKKLFELHRNDGSVISFKLYNDSSYPNANSVIPDLKDLKAIDSIGLNANLLSELADGLGCSMPVLKLTFFDKTKAIYVTSTYSDYFSAIGVIMPTMINI